MLATHTPGGDWILNCTDSQGEKGYNYIIYDTGPLLTFKIHYTPTSTVYIYQYAYFQPYVHCSTTHVSIYICMSFHTSAKFSISLSMFILTSVCSKPCPLTHGCGPFGTGMNAWPHGLNGNVAPCEGRGKERGRREKER